MAYGVSDLTVNINTVDRPQMVQAALQSLIDTTPAGVSLQIVFNGSPEATYEKITEMAGQWNGPTNVVYLEEMLSIDESHNRALAGIETPLVNFMGDDDVVLAPRIPAMLEAFNTVDPEPVVVTTFARRIAGDAFNPVIGPYKDLGPTNLEEWEAFHETGQSYELLWPGSILNTELLRELGGFEAAFSQSFDNRIFSQMSFYGPVLSLPERNFGFRIHQGSMSSSSWESQNEIVRFVEACHAANFVGRPEPSFEDFRSAEAAEPTALQLRRKLHDRSRIHFRKGGALALSGDRLAGAAHVAKAMVIWPPAFIEKVKDQLGNKDYRRS